MPQRSKIWFWFGVPMAEKYLDEKKEAYAIPMVFFSTMMPSCTLGCVILGTFFAKHGAPLILSCPRHVETV